VTIVNHQITTFARRLSLAAEFFSGVKQGRPDTSPLRALYAEWEQRTQQVLLSHWLEKSNQLTDRLRTDVKAVDDVLEDDGWWDTWTLGYVAVLITLLEEAGGVGMGAAIEAMATDYALGIDPLNTTLTVADWARDYAGVLAQGLTETDLQLLRRNLAAWAESGDPFPGLVKRIDSFINNPVRAKLIAATESTRSYAEGNLIVWRESGVVTGQRWNTANDERVCPVCGALHNQLTKLDGQEWQHRNRPDLSVGLSVAAPPAHPG
jgi:hypothetical protein